MKLTSLTIAGFRCFNTVGQTIALNDINCLVGPNASGKTATMMALVRLFGEHPTQRQLTTEDFHLAAGEQLKDKPQRTLAIECRIDFPELTSAGTTERTKQVLAANPKTAPNSTGSTYSPSQRGLFPWYKYLFIDGSKPVAYMRAMISLKNDDLLQAMPDIVENAKPPESASPKLAAFIRAENPEPPKPFPNEPSYSATEV